MGSFYSRLSYSFGNEDWRTERKALQIQPSDHVLCVTASGDRPLNLLGNELTKLVSVDANPLQNALFDLKRVAACELSYDDYLAFMGVDPSRNRLKTYATLEKHLDPLTSAMWERQAKKIKQGVLYQGFVEKRLSLASRFMQLLRGRKIEKLFAMNDLEEQRQFVAKHWHTFLWKQAFQIALHPSVTRTFISDPCLYGGNLDPSIHVGKELYKRLHGYLDRYLAKESIMLSLMFKGKVNREHFPLYLTKEGVEHIRSQSQKTEFHTADLVSFLEEGEPNSFDCLSISDVASYLDKAHFQRLVEGIFKTAKPGARFCMRQFLSNHEIPEHLAKHFKRKHALEKELQEEDCCFFYRFMTGTIEK